jgi:hypothetical protein
MLKLLLQRVMQDTPEENENGHRVLDARKNWKHSDAAIESLCLGQTDVALRTYLSMWAIFITLSSCLPISNH